MANIRNIEIKNKETSDKLFTAAKVICLDDDLAFINPETTGEKALFKFSDIGFGSSRNKSKKASVYRNELATNIFYEYALYSALNNHVNKILETKEQQNKEEEKKTAKEDEEKKRDPRVEKQLSIWKTKQKDNPKLYKSVETMRPPTRFYKCVIKGEDGKALNMGEISGLSNLGVEELRKISEICISRKAGDRSLAKSTSSGKDKDRNKDDKSSWVGTSSVMTPEGWRQYKLIEAEILYAFKLITKEEHDKKVAWCNEFDFHPGWNYESKVLEEQNSRKDYFQIAETLRDETQDTIEYFNKVFCLNAINKDGLLVYVED